MYADQTLTPKESIRLCALGTLALGPRRYSHLAVAIRHFISRIIGPTPEIMGNSIELLKYEGLVETISGEGDEAVLRITDDGREELRALLVANVRPSSTELTKLVMALKFRFLHLLEPAARIDQIRLLIDVCDREVMRLRDLRAHDAGDEGYLAAWLDHDIALLESRINWLETFAKRLQSGQT